MKTLNKIAILFALGSVAAFAANDINSTIDAKALFEAKCATCHGLKAEKKALGKSEIIAQNGYDDIIKDLKEFKNGKGAAIMQAQVKPLSEQELEAVAKYIDSLNPNKKAEEKENDNDEDEHK